MEMNQADIRKTQLMQLELVKKIHKVCEENGLKYIMLSGTLLGAVRHQGFIPWDDDLDIGLRRPDFEKLLAILEEKPIEGTFLQTFKTEKHYVQPYAKVRLDNTRYVESYSKDVDMHQGIFIDIFPLDKVKVPGSRTTELRRMLAKAITFSIWRKEKCHIVRKGLKRLEVIPSTLIGLLPKKLLVRIQNKLVIREKKNWEYASSMFSSNYTSKKVQYKLSDFDHLILLDFEDTKLYGPENYDKFLTRLFKNYMEYPPLEKRNSGHDLIELSFGDDEK